jgi:hypothetical protein
MAGNSSALAQGLTVEAEDSGEECSAISVSSGHVNGGCLTHATSEGVVELRKHVFGIESHITRCNNELSARIDGDGNTYVFDQDLTGAECSRQACNEETEADPWGNYSIPGAATPAPATSTESDSTGEAGTTEELTLRFCVETLVPSDHDKEDCLIEIPFETTNLGSSHRTEFGHVSELPGTGTAGFRCELVGHWNTESGGFDEECDPEIDVVITHD